MGQSLKLHILHIGQSRVTMYCEMIFIHWTFNFVFQVGMPIHKLQIQKEYLKGYFSFLKLKSMNSSAYEHVHYLQTTKFGAQDI